MNSSEEQNGIIMCIRSRVGVGHQSICALKKTLMQNVCVICLEIEIVWMKICVLVYLDTH